MSSTAPTAAAEPVVPKNIRWVLLPATAGESSSAHGASQAAEDAYLHATTHGIQQIFLVGAVCAAAAFLAAVFIQEVPLRKPPTGNQSTPKEPARATS
jgi:hypothetical protein